VRSRRRRRASLGRKVPGDRASSCRRFGPDASPALFPAGRAAAEKSPHSPSIRSP
jgi:hypothetical protein